MNDAGRTAEEFLSELARLRQRLAELAASESRRQTSNITERTQAEAIMLKMDSLADHIVLRNEHDRQLEALRTGEERMRFALEAAAVGIWDMDYSTGVLRWSEILESQHGLRPGTFGGTFEEFLDRIHPDDRESVAETIGRAVKTGMTFSTQHRTLWPDGTVRWLNGAGRVHLDENGEPLRGIGISQDVTERVRAEAEVAHLHADMQLQRLRVLKATMRTVHDIVNNLLNGLQLVHLQAVGHVPAETLELVDRGIREAAAKLKALGDLETVTEKEMAFGPGIDYPGSST